MFRAHQQFWGTVPDGDNDFVAGEQWLERLVNQSSQAKVANLDYTARCDKDIGGFEVTMEDMTRV